MQKEAATPALHRRGRALPWGDPLSSDAEEQKRARHPSHGHHKMPRNEISTGGYPPPKSQHSDQAILTA
jgi:hypothetical protein